MRIFKLKWFNKFATKENISDEDLIAAIEAANNGNIDANLGGGLIKQRIARKGKGKSGGYRSIICFRYQDRSIFLYGFAKSKRENITRDELIAYKDQAKVYLKSSEEELDRFVKTGSLTEVKYDK